MSADLDRPVNIEGPYGIGSDVWPGLAKLIEEAGEAQQVAGKIIAASGRTQHWDGSDLRARLIEELGDLRAAIIFLCEANGIPKAEVHDRADEKLAKFRHWHAAQGAATS